MSQAAFRTDLRATIISYLSNHNVATLATHGPDGPWTSAVFYVNHELALYFVSAPTTRHCRNLDQDPRAAAAIQEDYSEWKNIKGIQMAGRVSRLEGTECIQVARLYARKFTFVDPGRTAGAIAAAMTKISWCKLEPDTVYFIDNSLGLGHREQLDIGGDCTATPAVPG